MPPTSPNAPSSPTGEQHVYHSPQITYNSYLQVPELLCLQRPLSRPEHRDELLFIISHQVYELWFKQTIHELKGVNDYLDADQPLRAAQLLERIHHIQHLLHEQLPLLETMFSSEFAKFRGSLGTSSGFQSVQFRKLEFLCGRKNTAMLKLVGSDIAAKDEMAEYLDKPTPYDHFLRHLAREDDNAFDIPKDVLSRDTTQPHAEDERLVKALHKLYTMQDQSFKGERFYPQLRVAEALLEMDSNFQIWRFRHVKMVERMIGNRMGTGGSSGANYLMSTLREPFWPDLWAVRARLGGEGSSYPSHEPAPASGQAPSRPAGGGGCPMRGV